MKTDLYDKNGEKTGKKIELDSAVFEADINEDLMSQSIYNYLSNNRQVNAHTKTRAEIRGGGKKPWRQKGTGRARHGSIRSPIWKGGGTTFGPRNIRNHRKRMTKKATKAAIRSAFTMFCDSKRIAVLEDPELKSKKLTKQVSEIVNKLNFEGKLLFLHAGNNRELYLGGRNIKRISVLQLNEVNVYTLLNNSYLIVLESALDEISKNWGNPSKRPNKPEKKKKTKDGESIKRKDLKSKSDKDGDLESIGLGARIMSALSKAEIKSSSQLKQTIQSGEKIEGIGEKSIEEIKKVLKI